MKNFLLTSAVILGLTAAGGIAYKAAGDTGPPAPPGVAPPPGQWGGPGRGPWAGPWAGPGRAWGPCGPGGKGPGGPGREDKFSLFAPTQNKNLSSADVKTIATAILLEHGNHSWSVSNIVTEPDKSIQFSFTTQHGDVIATFAIDPATGQIKRAS